MNSTKIPTEQAGTLERESKVSYCPECRALRVGLEFSVVVQFET